MKRRSDRKKFTPSKVDFVNIEKNSNCEVVEMEKRRKLSGKKRIALIAHDAKKLDLVDWVSYNANVLKEHQLYATGTTGGLIKEKLGIKVKTLKSGPLGGDQQIGAMICEEKIDILIFFWDPLEPQAHDVDVKALLRIATVYNIPVAIDRSTADFLISSELFHKEYEIIVEDYEKTLKQRIRRIVERGTL